LNTELSAEAAVALSPNLYIRAYQLETLGLQNEIGFNFGTNVETDSGYVLNKPDETLPIGCYKTFLYPYGKSSVTFLSGITFTSLVYQTVPIFETTIDQVPDALKFENQSCTVKSIETNKELYTVGPGSTEIFEVIAETEEGNKIDITQSRLITYKADHDGVTIKDGSIRVERNVKAGTRVKVTASIGSAEAVFNIAVGDVVKEHIDKLKKDGLSGYYVGDIVSANLTGGETPQVVAMYYKSGEFYSFNTLVHVHTYDSNKGTWAIAKTFRVEETSSPLMYITQGALIDKNKEQVILGDYAGSGVYLTPFVIGSADGKQIKHFNEIDGSYFNGNAIVVGEELFFTHSNFLVAEKFKFENGRFKRYGGSGADDQKLAKGSTYQLTIEERNGKTVINGSRNIEMRVGETLALHRKSRNDENYYPIRVRAGTSFDIASFNNGLMVAEKAGTTSLLIETEAYSGDWVEIKIRVR
jgi:hypothetical protein